MGEKLKSLSALEVPGAGAYNPDASPTKKKDPSFYMGIKLKPSLDKLNVPGPGTYKNNLERMRQSAPSFGFGTSKRPGIKKSDVPGPGDYKLPRKISNAPDFALPGKTDEQKFI